MFRFSKKTNAAYIAILAMKPFISSWETEGNLPREFWEEPYILGFLHGAIGAFADEASDRSLTDRALGKVSKKVFEKIANENGQIAIRKLVEFSKQANADFLLGMDKGGMCVLIGHGAMEFEDDPDVILARKIAGSMPSEPDDDEALNAMMTLRRILFHEEVRHRLGIGSEEA